MLHRLLHAVPSACLVCASVCSNGICCDCLLELPWVGNCCENCGEEYSSNATSEKRCGRCLRSPPPFERCSSLFRYSSPVDKLLAGFKFSARFEAGNLFARLLADKMLIFYEHHNAPELIVPVPLHRNRLRQRGFNQALQISKLISRRSGIPYCYKEPSRIRDTQAQTELRSARARKANLRQAFEIGDKDLFAKRRHIAIIDDVVTTMTTVTSLSSELKLLGVERIDVWCVARASR